MLDIQGGVATMTFDRPAKHNALNSQMRSDLLTSLQAIGADSGVRALVLAGKGPSFCAGQDVKERKKPSESKRAALWGRERDNLGAVIASLPVPVIAALHGNVLGRGLDLAVAADLRIATPTAKLAYPEVERGMVVGGGGARRLARLIGESRAAEVLLCGTAIDGITAHQWGLVTRLAEEEQLVESALALASRLASLPATALYMAKATLRSSFEVPSSVGAWTDSALNVLGLQD